MRPAPYSVRSEKVKGLSAPNKPLALIIDAMPLTGNKTMRGILRELQRKPAPPATAKISRRTAAPVSTGSAEMDSKQMRAADVHSGRQEVTIRLLRFEILINDLLQDIIGQGL